MPNYEVRNWFETKREGVVLLKVSVTNKQKSKVKVALGFEADEGASLNVRLPKSMFKDKFVDSDTKCFMHLQKIDVTNPEWGKFRIVVKGKEVEGGIPKPPSMINNAGISTYPFMISKVGYATMGYGGTMMTHAPQDSVMVKC